MKRYRGIVHHIPPRNTILCLAFYVFFEMATVHTSGSVGRLIASHQRADRGVKMHSITQGGVLRSAIGAGLMCRIDSLGCWGVGLRYTTDGAEM